MGAAQSQTICPGRRSSVAHPASKAALTLSRAGSLNIMAGVLGGMERADAGIGAADGIIGLSSLAALTDGDPKRGDQSKGDGARKNSPSAEPREQGMCKPDHGVRPVR